MTQGLEAGNTLGERFRIEHVLGGDGAKTAILAAWDLVRNERVAIKILLPTALESPATVARFREETRSVQALSGPRLARHIEAGVLPDGTPFLESELLVGEDLAEILAREGRLPVARAVDIAIQVCEALASVHARGIVHRDLKAENVFVCRTEGAQLDVRVLDFGISKPSAPLASDPLRVSLTGEGVLLGTPRYMSPEQFRSTKHVDHRTDLWSLGVILHKMIAGEYPFDANRLTRLCVLVWSEPAPRLCTLRPDVPEGVEAAVLGCLEKEPERRHPSATALAEQLAPFASDRGRACLARMAPLHASPPAPARAWRTHPLRRGLLIAAILAALLAAALAWKLVLS